MRRALVKSFGPIRSAIRHRGDQVSTGVAKRLLVSNINDRIYDRSLYNGCKCGGPSYMFSRTLSSDAGKEVKRAGPLVEYERRIAAGDLEDGDNSQIGTLKELQRLYDELVKSADACRLDRYSDYEKAGRSRWLWSRIMPQSSVSPVKGLYLYGGVGTGKTMLMDLFYDQLPCNWRKKRIHFHDFMLTVHSRLQKHRGVSDPLEVVAGEISDESILLCLDEFMVTDVADALILNRLFSHLFTNGAVSDYWVLLQAFNKGE